MTTDLEQGVADLMDTLQKEPTGARPPVANIRQAARQKTARRRAAAGCLTALVMVPVAAWAWTNSSGTDSVVTASQDGTEGVQVEQTPQRETSSQEPVDDSTTPAVVPQLVVEVGDWMAVNSYRQDDPRVDVVRLVAQSNDPTTNGISIDISAVAGEQAESLTMFIFAECGPSLGRGSLVLEEGNTRFVDGVFPEGVKAALGAVAYDCSPPRSVQLDEVLAGPFELLLGDGRAELANSTTSISFLVAEPPG